jgi:hypothetical protein
MDVTHSGMERFGRQIASHMRITISLGMELISTTINFPASLHFPPSPGCYNFGLTIYGPVLSYKANIITFRNLQAEAGLSQEFLRFSLPNHNSTTVP